MEVTVFSLFFPVRVFLPPLEDHLLVERASRRELLRPGGVGGARTVSSVCESVGRVLTQRHIENVGNARLHSTFDDVASFSGMIDGSEKPSE